MASLRLLFLAIAAFIAVEAVQLPPLSSVKPILEARPGARSWQAAIAARNAHLKQPRLPTGHSRIVGGGYASAGDFPYQAALFLDDGMFCGGSIISNNWILTAGHCGYGVRTYTAVLGTLSIENTPDPSRVVVTSSEGYVHPNFNPQSLVCDLTLVRLPQMLQFGPYINAVSLGNYYVDAGAQVVVSGWGKTSDSSSISPRLKYVGLTTISNNDCAGYYGGMITEGNICCAMQGESTCQGDSGGPLVYGGVQIGIVSFGGQSCLGAPPSFTRVSYFINWIAQVTNSR